MKLEQIYQCFPQRIHDSIWNHDPFKAILNFPIQSYLLPFDSVEDLYDRRVNRKRLRILWLLYSIQTLTIGRLLGSVVAPTEERDIFLISYFRGRVNSRPWLLVTSLFLILAFAFQYVLWTIIKRASNRYTVEILLTYSRLYTAKHKPAHFIQHTLINILLLNFLSFFRVLFLLFFLLFCYYDGYTAYSQLVDWNFVFRHFLLTTTFLTNVFCCTSISVFWLLFLYTLVVSVRSRLVSVHREISILAVRSKFFSGTEVFQSRIEASLRDLQSAIHYGDQVFKQVELLIFTFYYGILLLFDGGMFIIVDRKTDPLIRIVAIITCAFTFTAFVPFHYFNSVYRRANRIAATIDHLLHRRSIGVSVTLKLVEMKSLLDSGLVSVPCYGIFTFTTAKVADVILLVCVNFFLVTKLFRNYFFD